MNRRAARRLATILSLVSPVLPRLAGAAPLELESIYELNRFVQCQEACVAASGGDSYEARAEHYGCLAACGAPDHRWEKDGVASVSRRDLDLALLETMDAADPTAELVCYRGAAQDVVVPGALCSGELCTAMPACDTECALPTDTDLDCTDNEPGGPRCWWPSSRRPAACPDVVCAADPGRSVLECTDADADGAPAWLEAARSTSDNQAQPSCGPSNACAFDQACVYDEDLGSGQCALRDCGGACTAFHLELVAQDDRELLLWVHYDYSPIPARVLDLNLVYDRDALILQDARPLPALTAFGKHLASSALSDGTQRLSVYDTASAWPIPQGPIIELVFQRLSDAGTLISFETDDAMQYSSLAPLQGDVATQAQLTNDALWGAPIFVPDRADIGTTLRLWYDFEDPASPLGYGNVPTGEELCARVSECANEDDPVVRARMIGRLTALQSGALSPTDRIAGVTGDASYLDGVSDHARLPVHYDAPLEAQQQSMSFATWFYTEGNSGNEPKDAEQLLFTHNAFNERTSFGFKLEGIDDASMALVFFDGDLLSKSPPPAEVLVAPRLGLREWHNLGFTFDAPSGQLDIYLDGARVALYTFVQPPSAIQCPQFADGTDILLHTEGDVLGGKPPEFIYTAVRRSNLYKIERMDLHGLTSEQIIGDGQFSYRDADYSPILDRLVYSSNASGNFEIWIANGDGTGRQQITNGFGDTARGIFAKRPKWAPDGSAIVFESNAFDVLAEDNSFRRVYHLYYVAFDRLQNRVAVPLESGAVVEILDYTERVTDQTIGGYRLTSIELDRNHGNAQWLRGKHTDGAGVAWRGELIMGTSGPRLDANKIMRVRVPDNIYATLLENIPGLGSAGQELELIAGHRSVRVAAPQNIVTERLLYTRSFATYESEDQFTLSVRALPAPADPFNPNDPNAANGPFGGYEVTVTHDPSGYGAQCWDRNVNGLRDTDEDRNQDLAWDTTDCYPHEVRNLYVDYDGVNLSPVLMDDDGNYLTPGDLLAPVSQGGTNKELQLQTFYPSGRSLLRVEVLSPTNGTPLPPGEVAVLRYRRNGPANYTREFSTTKRLANDELMVKDLNLTTAPWELPLGGVVEHVEQATFSPQGTRLLLAGTSKARPILVVTDDLRSVSGAERISSLPMAVRGLNWVREERFYACNWFGGYQHLQTKLIESSFRGGLDDMRVWSGLRDPDAFRSEAERGFERLDADGRRKVDSRLPSCGSSHRECPAYHLCMNSECVMVACDPTDPYSCTQYGGRCTLRPTSAEQGYPGVSNSGGQYDFVCATDCSVDRECFSQACLNGPCRFCETESQACIECREAVTQLGALALVGIEGCPDRRSFSCEAGACLTECYAIGDGQSQYLCDPTTEYCDRGRCVLLDWDWWDFAPATFAGLGEMRQVVSPNQFNGYTQAVDQSIPIEIQAYAVADYLTAPEMVVEVRGGPFYGSNWARIGRISVYQKTRTEARQQTHNLSSPVPFDEMRLRLITDPQVNIGRAATGMGTFDEQFCLEERRRYAQDTNTPFDAAPCYRRAQGSRFTLGYPLGIPLHEGIAACREHGRAGCPSVASDEFDFLAGGSPAVVVLEAKVDRGSVMNAITQNRVCSYEGSLVPRDNGAAKKVFYGDVRTEQSNQRDAYCAANPGACAAATSLLEFNPALRGYALLNCNVFEASGVSAGVTFQGIPLVQEWPARRGPIVQDDGDTCTVELDAARVAPCYEWTGGDVSADPATYLGVGLNGSLELTLFRTFGHEDGFTSVPLPTWPLRLLVTGYPGGGLTITNGSDTLSVAGAAASQTLTFAQPVKEGRRFQLRVTQQPGNGNVLCSIDAADARGTMAPGGVTVPVRCTQQFSIGGTVAGLGSGAVVTLRNVVTTSDGRVRTEDLSVPGGAFEFGRLAEAGASYEVRVPTSPYGYRCSVSGGSGRVVSNDITSVAVSCVAVPFFDLGVTVSGLRGAGLEVLDRESGATLQPTSDGAWIFPTQIAEGAAYDLVVTDQPTGPAQACTFTTAQSGAMPRENHLRNYLSCTDVPTYAVRGRVLGMRGDGLRLALNGAETITVNSPEPLTGDVAFTFATQLLSGDAYTVAVAQNPSLPADVCQVVAPTGVVEGAAVELIVTCQAPNNTNGYTIGGTVSGLAGTQQPGTGLRLALNGGTQTLLVAGNGSFSFEQQAAADSSYEVTVDRAPSSPPQSCRVVNGAGTVGTSNITNIQVICDAGGTVEVRLSLPTSEGAVVRAVLASADATVGELPASAKIQSGQYAAMVRAPNSANTAVMAPGTYALYLFVNQNGSVDSGTGKPTWDIYDLGLSRLVTVTAYQTTVVTVGTTSVGPLLSTRTTAFSTAVPADSVVSCYWGVDGSGTTDLPIGERSPVIGKAARLCQDGQSCWPAGMSITDANDVVPAGSYDVTCWVDANESRGFDRGDYIGTQLSVDLPGSAPLIFLNRY